MGEILQISSVSHENSLLQITRKNSHQNSRTSSTKCKLLLFPPTIMEHQIGSTKDVFVPKKIVVLCNLWEVLSVPGDSKWRYRPLVGGQQQPLKRSLNPSLEKGHQQNCHEFSSSWFPNRWSSEGISFRNASFRRGHIFYRNEFQRFVVQNWLDALLYGHQKSVIWTTFKPLAYNRIEKSGYHENIASRHAFLGDGVLQICHLKNIPPKCLFVGLDEMLSFMDLGRFCGKSFKAPPGWAGKCGHHRPLDRYLCSTFIPGLAGFAITKGSWWLRIPVNKALFLGGEQWQGVSLAGGFRQGANLDGSFAKKFATCSGLD